MNFFGRKKELTHLLNNIEQESSVSYLLGTKGVGKSAFIKKFIDEQETREDTIVVHYSPHFLVSGSAPFIEIIARIVTKLTDPASPLYHKKNVKALKYFISSYNIPPDQVYPQEYFQLLMKALPENSDFGKVLLKKITKGMTFERSDAREKNRLDYFCRQFFDLVNAILAQFSGKKLIVVIDPFENLREDAAVMIVRQSKKLPKGLHLVLGLNSGGMRARRLLKHIYELFPDDESRIIIKGLRKQTIAQWLKQRLNQEISKEQVDKIYRATGGQASKISTWLDSPEFDLEDINEDKITNSYYFKEKINSMEPEFRRFVRQLSVLDFPLTIEEYSKITRFPIDEVKSFCEQLRDMGIFVQINNQFWFRSLYHKELIYEGILINLIKKYHQNVVKHYESIHSEVLNSPDPDALPIIHNYAWHLHKSMDYRRSFHYNLRLGHRYLKLNNYAIAAHCLKLAREAGKLVGYDEEAQSIRGNIAYVETILELHEEVYPVHKELSEYFAKKQDMSNLSVSLFYYGISAFNLGRFQEAQNAFEGFLQCAPERFQEESRLKVKIFLGEISCRLKEFDKAQIVFDETLQIAEEDPNPENLARILYLGGNIAYLQSNSKDAEERYQKCLKTALDSNMFKLALKAEFNLVIIRIIEQKYDEALALLKEIKVLQTKYQNFSGYVYFLTLKGITLFYKKEIDESWESLERALQIAEQQGYEKIKGVLTYYLGLIQKSEGHYQEAQHSFEEALTTLPQDLFPLMHGTARVNLAILQEECGILDDALQQLNSSIELFRKNNQVETLARSLWRSGMLLLKKGNNAEAKTVLTECRTLFLQIDAKQAIEQVDMILVTLEDNIQTSEELYEYYQELLKSAEENNNTREKTEAYYNLGIWAQSLNKFDQAIDFFTRCYDIMTVEKYPDLDASVKLKLGILYYHKGEMQKAKDFLTECNDMSRNRGDKAHEGESAYFLGITLIELDEVEEAEAQLRRSIRRFRAINQPEKLAHARLWLGKLEELSGNTENAQMLFADVLQTYNFPPESPIWQEIHFRQGNLALKAGDFDRARRFYKLVCQSPQNKEYPEYHILSYCQLGMLNQKSRRFKEAMNEYLTAKQLVNSSKYSEQLVNKLLENMRNTLGKSLYTKYIEDFKNLVNTGI